MFPDMGWLSQLSFGDWLAVAGLPLMVVGYLEAYKKWGPSLAGLRRPIGLVFLGAAAIAYAGDLADRFGAFGPTKADLQQSVVTLDGKRARLQGQVDYWHNQTANRDLSKGTQNGPNYRSFSYAPPNQPQSIIDLENNRADNNGKDGIHVELAPGAKAIVKDNETHGNRGNGTSITSPTQNGPGSVIGPVHTLNQAPSTPLASAQRDPDGIYQNGLLVGTADGAHSDQRGYVTFDHILNAKKLNFHQPLEYREYKLRIVSPTTITAAMDAEWGPYVIDSVTAEIIGNDTGSTIDPRCAISESDIHDISGYNSNGTPVMIVEGAICDKSTIERVTNYGPGSTLVIKPPPKP